MNAAEALGAQALLLAREVAIEAGAILLEYFGRLDVGQISSKSAARDLVTEADVASERHIVRRIRESFPDHAIEAEEEVHELGASGPRWLIDPLDGTVNFVHGLPCFCVSIALYVGDQPLCGVVHVPVLGETFCASKGVGATLNNQPIRVSSTEKLGEALLATGFAYRRDQLAMNNLDNFSSLSLEVRGMRRMGSAALDLAYTAAGRLDGFWELHLSAYDVAAGAILVREAGGVVSDADGGEDWLYGGHIVAAGESLQTVLRSRVRH